MLTTIKSWKAGASVGRSLFDTLSTLAFGLCLLARIFTTSGYTGENPGHVGRPVRRLISEPFECGCLG
jgi:hypothetical protein